MADYGSATYGVSSYGVPDPVPTGPNAPTSWTPAYSTRTDAAAARGGAPGSLDLDVTTGQLGRSARGDPGLVSGGDRVVSAVVRALLTPKGSNWFDPQYGSQALPGQTVTNNLMLQTADAVLYELRRGSRLFSGAVRVDAQEQPSDPRNVQITVTIQAASGPQSLSFPFTVPGGVA
jgi:hypothetical protein